MINNKQLQTRFTLEKAFMYLLVFVESIYVKWKMQEKKKLARVHS